MKYVTPCSSRPQRCKVVVPVLLIVSLTSPAMHSVAAPLPPMDKTITLMARETSVNEFLVELFGSAGVPVVVDEQIKGTVNGDWTNTARELLDHTMKSFQLLTYFDGQVAHVYYAHDLQQKMLPVSLPVGRKIISAVNQLALNDKNNLVGPASEGGLAVRGTQRFIEQINEISRSIRRKSKVYVPRVVEKLFYLRHAWVQDSTLEMAGQSMVVPGIVSILQELIAKQPLSEGTRSKFSSLNHPVDSLENNEVSRVAQSLQQLQGNPAAPEATESSPDVSAVAKTQTDEGMEPTRVVAVPRLNAVLVRDLENRMSSYAALIQALDVEPYMLEIEATIIDVSTDRSKEFGVNWRYRRDDGSEALVGNGTISDQLLNPDQQITPQGQGGILSLALGNPASQFLSRIRALETEGDAEIVSKPHVVTLSNVEAVLDTTKSFFVRVAAADDASLFKITAGTTLRVTPHVYRMDGKTRIKLMVNIEDGATSSGEVDQIPVIGNSTIRTQAIITDGDSLLVGGLVRESKQRSESKVPLLGDIPGLGSVFRTKIRSGGKVERLFLITPRLAFRDGFNSERRMDAPILQGNEGEILGTAGQRLESTRKAMMTGRAPASKAGPMSVSPGQTESQQKKRAPKQHQAPASPEQSPAINEGQLIAEQPSAATKSAVAKARLIRNLLRMPKSTNREAASEPASRASVANGTGKWIVQASQQPAVANVQPAGEHSESDVTAGSEPTIDTFQASEKLQESNEANTTNGQSPIRDQRGQPVGQNEMRKLDTRRTYDWQAVVPLK